ncbi:non-specific riboncleoside hydrolase [Dethiosulfatibacter aminovorans DSM 17477]|uniref:Non-specific riboncleoside hydrolase n=1 Tax=Dethiosulfatibacter aminovorans DSM 17477 TaxID=1121476 RepID=A0A1M6KBY3_9FIRM|nr:nucleoside hydrolase [Dethiosulfatibacter aminovorans]SHJ56475.1 non-specific riboncleoside hydrolase [Dethiosulfatibacter aminovorans DSM 17477]
MDCEKIKILIDTDPGYDDAAAIIAAAFSSKLDLLGLTTVFGNTSLDIVNRNAASMIEYFNLDISYAFGEKEPLNGKNTATEVSEKDVFGLPECETKEDKRGAVEFLKDKLEGESGLVTLVTLGPLTNISKLLKTHPGCKKKIEKIIMMGGALNTGNITSAAEFNIYCDPEAAKDVFGSGIEIVMAGLDVTRETRLYGHDLEKLSGFGDKQRKLVEIIKDCSAKYSLKPEKGIPVHDVCTIMYLLEPEIFGTEKYNVDVETRGEITRGMTLADRRPFSNLEKNTTVLTKINIEKFKEVFFGIMAEIQRF